MAQHPYTGEPSAENEFDLRARAELSLAYDPGQPPRYLLRHTTFLARRGVQGGIAALLIFGAALGSVLALRPPELVRGVIEHEYFERTLRGNFMDAKALQKQLGLDAKQSVPGSPQLMRPCDIDGQLAYHLTTFFEKGGMVTVFAFEQPVVLKPDAGWWDSVYWQVMNSRDGKPLVLVAQKKKALAVAQTAFTTPATY